MLILQRRLLDDGSRWRSVVPFSAENTEAVYRAVSALMEVSSMNVQWRLVRATPAQERVAVCVNGRWVDPTAYDSPWLDSPHRRDSEWAPGDFAATIPTGTQ